MFARLKGLLPKRHTVLQAAGIVGIGLGALVLFGIGVALMVAGSLVLLFGAAEERG